MEDEGPRSGARSGSRTVLLSSTTSLTGAAAPVERPPSSIQAATEEILPRRTPENRRRRETKVPRRAYRRGENLDYPRSTDLASIHSRRPTRRSTSSPALARTPEKKRRQRNRPRHRFRLALVSLSPVALEETGSERK